MSEKPKALSDTEVRNVVKTAITEAVDYVESEISPDREKAMRYYSGKCDIGSRLFGKPGCFNQQGDHDAINVTGNSFNRDPSQ